jgi:murein DD-endopeptidase MepM/ murein hydrolase activator NlpD
VIIDHGNGYTTQYSHLSAIYVTVGQKVSKGDVIAAMGSTGRSTGVHLDFIIRKDGTALNPLGILGR